MLIGCTLWMGGCKKGGGSDQPALSSAKEITYFALEEFQPPLLGEIDQVGKLIRLTVPEGTDITALSPVISVSAKANVSPASGETTNFNGGRNYKVTAEDGTVEVYFVQVNSLANENTLMKFDFPELFVKGVVSDHTVTFEFLYGTDLTNLKATVEISPGASLNFDPASPLDLTSLSKVEVTSEFGQTRVYDVQYTIAPQETAVRGVWLTNVASDALVSKAKIIEAMDRLEELNFNTVFVVTWNKTQTPYPSDVLKAVIDDPSVQTEMFPGRDALQELIDEAHARDIKVIAWFEYGFAAQYGDANGGRNIVLQKHPEWESRDANGNLAQQNNFYWMNAFHPEVQQFLLDMMLEVVEKYDVDGIQGDDRLPAVTSASGYDDYTVQRYKDEHNGNAPPTQAQNQAWVQWRSDILSEFGQRVYNEVKALDPNCLVTWSPSPYSFSFFNYCQDWPDWVSGGYADIVSPQLYRRDDQGLAVYTSLLNSNLSNAFNNKEVFYPGILLQSGGYVPNAQYLVNVIRENRKKGVKGEVFFFYEGLKIRDDVFRAMYPGKALFPSF